MQSSPRITQAIALATKLHEGQFRRNGITPYVTHPIAVAEILSEYTQDEDILIAAIMHDTIEDVPGYTYERLVSDCGQRVADIVEGVTEDGYPEGYRDLVGEEKVKAFEAMLIRQAEKVEHAGIESMYVSAADKTHNLEGIVEGVAKDGIGFLKLFRMNMDQKLGYYRDILRRVEPHINENLAKRFKEGIEAVEKVSQEASAS